MKSIVLLLVMSCTTLSLSAQWETGFPKEELSLGRWQNRFQKDTVTSSTFSERKRKYSIENHSNLVRRNAITHQLDSIIILGPSEYGPQWIERARIIFQYNAEEKLEEESVAYFNELLQTWEYSYKVSYKYNEDQKLAILSSLDWDADAGDWVDDYKIEYEYDHLMRLIYESLFYWRETYKRWEGSSKTSFTYKLSNQLASEIYSSWNVTDLWIEMYRDEYNYATDGKIIELVTSEKYNPNPEWKYTNRMVFEYDSLRQLIYENNFYYQENGSWLLISRQANTYDANGNVIEELNEFWYAGTDAWQPGYLDQFTYDENGHQTSYFWFTWDDITGTWEGRYGGTAVFNEDGDYTELVDLKWNDITLEWELLYKTEYEYESSVLFENILWPYPKEDPYAVYQRMITIVNNYKYEGDWILQSSTVPRYSIRTSALSLTIEPLIMSPNPANDFIQFSVPDVLEGSTLSVYSPDGKLMISTTTFEKMQVSTSSLTPGWYIARIQNGKDLYVGKFMKE